jgi:SPX domain protein involved in polyphosphate accumulation
MTTALTSPAHSLEQRHTTEQPGVLDGIIFQRYEYKYAIPLDLIAPIRSFIQPYCEMDVFSAREEEKFYTITSLYLDTDKYKIYWDKEEDVPARFKIRIRTYGTDSDGPVKFEVKHRLNEIVRKKFGKPPCRFSTKSVDGGEKEVQFGG